MYKNVINEIKILFLHKNLKLYNFNSFTQNIKAITITKIIVSDQLIDSVSIYLHNYNYNI